MIEQSWQKNADMAVIGKHQVGVLSLGQIIWTWRRARNRRRQRPYPNTSGRPIHHDGTNGFRRTREMD